MSSSSPCLRAMHTTRTARRISPNVVRFLLISKAVHRRRLPLSQ
ncbi:hypothetical protein M6B38_350830 [Iris pallida]|uniref:Uncharacterized protein n=1 Tax=Iris pallida TaxID=29817 RepID=A0AAX6EAK5_IRIPA|nr:hypothetical protein M6B38_200540 [Iris pallida]KAJ6800971.1 hypothetical protein M6B38_200545 [Iris pallida]KAJ6831218.1 hypothetical protein M6B38_350830 [Iris pallida]